MQSFGTPFGTAVYGRDPVANVGDCPVPEGVAGVFFTPQEHDSWCNCVYGAVPDLNALCKIKIGETLPNGETYLDPGMPWTVTGKRTRGLLDDAFGRLLRSLMSKANQVVTEVMTQDGSHPAQPVGPGTTASPNQTAAEMFYLLPQGGARQMARSGQGNTTSVFDLSVSDESSKKLLLGGAVAFGVWYFLVRDQPRSVAGFGGYRRRSRRSRR